jgi:hypothetical protein
MLKSLRPGQYNILKYSHAPQANRKEDSFLSSFGLTYNSDLNVEVTVSTPCRSEDRAEPYLSNESVATL